MKKIIKQNFFGFILGGIIFGSISVYAATVLSSSSVSYSNTNSKISATNAQDAIDELYTKGQNTKKEIIIPSISVSGGGGITYQNQSAYRHIRGYSSMDFNINIEGYSTFIASSASNVSYQVLNSSNSVVSSGTVKANTSINIQGNKILRLYFSYNKEEPHDDNSGYIFGQSGSLSNIVIK